MIINAMDDEIKKKKTVVGQAIYKEAVNATKFDYDNNQIMMMMVIFTIFNYT